MIPRDHRSVVKGALCLAVLLWAAGPAGAAKEIDPGLLAIKDCPALPGCPALVLSDETEFNNESNRTKLTRRQLVKLFTQEGIDRYGQVMALAQVGGWDIRDLSGRTILPDGTSLPLKQSNVHVKYFRAGRQRHRVKTAAFPGLVPGAIIEWSYNVMTDQNSQFTRAEWDVQKEIPVLSSRFTLKPGRWRMEWKPAGMEKLEMKTEHPFRNVYHFSARNIRPIPSEPFGPSPDAQRARLIFDQEGAQSTWLTLFTDVLSGYTGRFIDTAPGVADKVREIVAASDPSLARARKIYRFIQEKIGPMERRLEETEEPRTKEAENAGEVLARGYGSEEERTLLFLAMAKEAKLEAKLVMIVGRGKGVFDRNVPDPDQFDSFAAAVWTGTEWTYFDPGTPYCPPGALSAEKEGESPNALMIQPNRHAGEILKMLARFDHVFVAAGGKPAPEVPLRTIPSSSSARNVLSREATVTLGAGGVAEMEVTDTGTGLVDLEHRQTYGTLGEEERRKKLAEILRGPMPRSELLSASFDEIGSFDTTATLRYRLRLPDAATVAGDRVVVTPSILHAGTSNPFVEGKRETPVLLPYRRTDEEVIAIQVPEGYETLELPAAEEMSDPPFTFSFRTTQDGSRILFSRRVEVDTLSWPAADFARLSAFFGRLQEADRRVIVFKKKEGR